MLRHKRPQYIHVYKDRYGKQRIYFNRAGEPKSPLPAPLYSEEFWVAYHKAHACEFEKPPIGAARTISGSMSALIVQYYQCSEFTALAPNTRSTYRNQLEAFRKQHGDGLGHVDKLFTHIRADII